MGFGRCGSVCRLEWGMALIGTHSSPVQRGRLWFIGIGRGRWDYAALVRFPSICGTLWISQWIRILPIDEYDFLKLVDTMRRVTLTVRSPLVELNTPGVVSP